MQVEVFHKDMETQELELVATVKAGTFNFTDALEYAYRRTQNIEGSWSRGKTIVHQGKTFENADYSEDVSVIAELPRSERTGEQMGLRSSMVGDVFEILGVKYEVAFFGFEKIS